MVSRGTLESAGHGIYRVRSLPLDRYDEFILARYWAAGRDVISHDSGLLVHDLCDINPTRVHLTIPTLYRISRASGDRYEVHHADLEVRHIVKKGTAMQLRLGIQARSTTDLDVAFAGRVEDWLDRFDTATAGRESRVPQRQGVRIGR